MPSFLSSAISGLPSPNSFNIYGPCFWDLQLFLLLVWTDLHFFLICTTQKWTWCSLWGHATDKLLHVFCKQNYCLSIPIWCGLVSCSSLTLNNFELMAHHTLEMLFYSVRDHNYSACHYTADCFYIQNLTFTTDWISFQFHPRQYL